MVGLNVPRPIVRQVARKGFESLSQKQRGKIRVATCDVDMTYQRTLQQVLGQKETGGTIFTRFCQAQVVWDTAMAINALDYAKDNSQEHRHFAVHARAADDRRTADRLVGNAGQHEIVR